MHEERQHAGQVDSVAATAAEAPDARARTALRIRLLAAREAFVADRLAQARADAALADALRRVVGELDPTCLGLYWAQRAEFNAASAVAADTDGRSPRWPLALPVARRDPPRMTYRAWNGAPPSERDDHGIPTSDGPAVEPDVVLVPCVGYTEAGWRLGYGGGYFDRWLAARPGVVAVGVAWAAGRIGASDFVPATHDVPLACIVTEDGVVRESSSRG